MKIIFALMIAMTLMTHHTATADTKDMKMPEPTMEQRLKLAEAHEKMATCLKSETPLSECRAEMMKHCEEVMGAKGCPMMGKMGRAYKKGQMMKNAEEKK
ncbi:MAG: hypothetical protein A2X86_10870 [Bdellovibrionales bacterium GWA2_49_15]|nr:MAG: hypothetical protein A2X86_10870 [Bdellovibrionales bacterium GWA2_49_15]HAZ11478.1 hypothetical protein [Bdellovibrionales bacterium]